MVHKTAIIDENVIVSPTAKIWHWTHIREGVTIGENVIIGQGCYIDHDVIIPNGCKIQNHVGICYGVELSENVFIGPYVAFTNDRYPRAFDNNWKVEKTIIKTGASIGASATVLCGVIIGEYAMIGAGSVIISNVPNNAVMVGNPAKQISMCGDDGFPTTSEDYFHKVDGFNRPFINSDFPEYTLHSPDAFKRHSYDAFNGFMLPSDEYPPEIYGQYIRRSQYMPLEIKDKKGLWRGIPRGLHSDAIFALYKDIWAGSDVAILKKAIDLHYKMVDK